LLVIAVPLAGFGRNLQIDTGVTGCAGHFAVRENADALFGTQAMQFGPDGKDIQFRGVSVGVLSRNAYRRAQKADGFPSAPVVDLVMLRRQRTDAR
jgi:hypothetical protein